MSDVLRQLASSKKYPDFNIDEGGEQTGKPISFARPLPLRRPLRAAGEELLSTASYVRLTLIGVQFWP